MPPQILDMGLPGSMPFAGDSSDLVIKDPGYNRPYFAESGPNRGQKVVVLNTGRTRYDAKVGREVPVYREMPVANLQRRGISPLVFNATTSLRKQEWIMLDLVVLKAARERLRAWGDLAAANTYGGFNGMSKLILEHETMSDPGEAQIDMDALTEGRTDSPTYQLEGLPLPITHSDFWFGSRRLAASRTTGTPLDTTMAEASGRRVAETIEQLTIGTLTGPTWGTAASYGRTPQVYGYTNFTNRNTKTNLTTPTGSNPEVTLADVLAMRSQLYSDRFYGPYMLYHSTDWDVYMDNDYARLGGNNASMTLRDRLRKIEGIQDVRRLDFLRSSTNPFTLLMVQMTSDVARAVNGMDITTVQWESMGGMRVNFKVMCIMVPQLRADFNGNCGIVHATTA